MSAVALGVSPAGVEWVVYPRGGETPERFAWRVQRGQERLAALAARLAARAEPEAPSADLARLRARHAAARREVFRLLGQDRAARARGRYARAWDRPEYVAAYERLQASRKGDRYGEVVKVEPERVRVRLDKSGKSFWFRREDVLHPGNRAP